MDAEFVEYMFKGVATVVVGALVVGAVTIGGCSYVAGRKVTEAKSLRLSAPLAAGAHASNLELLTEDIDRDGAQDALLKIDGQNYLIRRDAASGQVIVAPYRVDVNIVVPNTP